MPLPLDRDRYHDLDKNRVLNFISPANIEIPISKADYNYFIIDKEYRDMVHSFEEEICSIYDGCYLKKKFKDKLHISLLPDFLGGNISERYFIGYSPKEIVNSIFSILGVNPNYANFDNMKYDQIINYYENAMRVKQVLKTYISLIEQAISRDLKEQAIAETYGDLGGTLTLQSQIENRQEKLKFAKASYDNVDHIFDLYTDRRLSNHNTPDGENGHILWRNLAYLLAINSLKMYNRTKDNAYLVYPYKLYEKCTKPDSKGDQMLFCNALLVDDIDSGMQVKFDAEFIAFNNLCEKIFTNNPLAIEFLLDYQDNNFITVCDTLKPDELLLNGDKFAKFLDYKVSKTRVEDQGKEKETKQTKLFAEKQFFTKVHFYSYNSDFSNHVLCRTYVNEKNETGYVGFILDNDYIVFDKFYKERKDGTCEPVMNSAVYVVPIDLFVKLHGSTTAMRLYYANSKDGKIIRLIHDRYDSYTKGLIDIANRPSGSSIKSEDYIKTKGGKIVGRKKSSKIPKKVMKPNEKKD